MLNAICVEGFLANEVKVGENGNFALLTVACQRNYPSKTTRKYEYDFIDVLVSGSKAVEFYKKLHKRDPITICGSMHSRILEKGGIRYLQLSVTTNRFLFSPTKKADINIAV